MMVEKENDYYYKIDNAVRAEIDAGQAIAIYPMGKNGMLANQICMSRYGIEPIVIDNFLAKYNKKIMSLQEYLLMDNKNTSIILCIQDSITNKKLASEMEALNVKAKIVNIYVSEKEEYFKKIKLLCKVRKCMEAELIRIGRKHDGGYVMIDDLKNDYIAYSFGIFDDVSWDKGIAARIKEVHCYDHTIERLPEQDEKLIFHKKGIAGVVDYNNQLFTMEYLIKENNHNDNNNLILKMDVEGAEWDFIESTPSDVLRQFRQMTFEFHNFTLTDEKSRIIKLLSKLNETHQVVWVHANNAGRLEREGDYEMPIFLEITYARKDLYEFEDTIYNSPINIDSPNIEKYGELQLINW